MPSNLVLVDPLAVLFRPALAGQAPLTLADTTVEVDLAPPLARVAITRRFINDGDAPIEAVLTLPPVAEHEVVYGLAVTLDGIEYLARPLQRQGAARHYAQALMQGRVAILHEYLTDGVQLVSIGPIGPRAQVQVRVESIRPLAYPDALSATLRIMLSADPGRLNDKLSDADALTLTSQRHPATLTVSGYELRVFHVRGPVPLNAPVAIDCAAPILLQITAIASASLERTDHRPSQPEGWCARIVDRGPGVASPASLPVAPLGGRSVFGYAILRGRFLEVRAPAPERIDQPGDAMQRAMTAMAVSLAEARAPGRASTRDCVAANLLSRDASLIFVGPDGQTCGDMPSLRKLALPQDLLNEVPLQEKPVGPHGVDTPGARLRESPSHAWIAWALALVTALLTADVLGIVRVAVLPLSIGVVLVLLLAAYVSLPDSQDPVRRRLPWLSLLPIPWLVAIAFGPLGMIGPTADPARQSWMLLIQNGAVVAAVLLPLALLPQMRRARRFTGAVGALNLLIALTVNAISSVIIAPGS